VATETLIEVEEFHMNRVAQISLAHLVHDSYIAFLPAMLPVLIQKFSLTNSAAGLLTVFMQFPSILQPLIGRIGDQGEFEKICYFHTHHYRCCNELDRYRPQLCFFGVSDGVGWHQFCIVSCCWAGSEQFTGWRKIRAGG
jgi:hypothetical protein